MVPIDLGAFVLLTVVEALTHEVVLRRPDILRDEKAQQFVDNVTRLVIRYLRASQREAGTSPIQRRTGGASNPTARFTFTQSRRSFQT